MPEKNTKPLPDKSSKKNVSSYTIEDVFKITDELLQLSKEKKYHPGAFVHGLMFTLEFAQQSYNIPQQQLAEIKRNCRRYVSEIIRVGIQKASAGSPQQ